MSRDVRWRIRIQDILDAVDRVREYTDGVAPESFYEDQKTIDAVVRNLEIIGEAAGHVPPSIRRRAPGIPWDQVRGMRNVLVHEYGAVDVEVVWETARSDLPSLVEPLRRLLEEGSEGPIS